MLAKYPFGRADEVTWRESAPSESAAEKSSQARRREHERAIEKAVASLARLDDRTLRGLGIFHRSHIGWTVRYCHDC